MLICKNCYSPNSEGSTTCSTCKMPGMLVRDNTIVLPDLETGPKTKINCRNCGHDNPEEHRHCTRCKFPLPKGIIKSSGAKTVQNK